MTTKTILLRFFIVLKMGMQYILINPLYQLHRDEYLHLDQGKHLAWGYLSVPPVTSWISYIILQLGGDVFWVKFFPALFGTLTMVVVWKTVEELKGGSFALSLSAVAVIFSALLRINILYQPNSLDILCWTLLYFFLIKFIHYNKNQWLYLAALTLAIGFLNKYNIVFLLLGMLPALLLTRQWKIFLTKHFYLSMLLVLVLILPNLVWQYQNEFPVFHHLKALAETQLINVNRIDFLKEQLLFFIGSAFILLAALISFFIYPPFKKYQMFFWALVFTLIIFIYFRAKAYYAIGLYPIFLAFGSVYLEELLKNKWYRYLRPVVILLPILFFIPHIKIALPILTPEEINKLAPKYKDYNTFRWEDGKDHSLPQDFADMLGWRELAQKVDSAYEKIAEKDRTLILCDNYGQAGAINYYTKHKELQAVSMSADYIHWFPLHEMEVKHVILVQEKEDTDKERKRERQLFKSVDFFGEIENPHAREQGTRIYLLQEARVSINEILLEEISERKKFQ